MRACSRRWAERLRGGLIVCRRVCNWCTAALTGVSAVIIGAVVCVRKFSAPLSMATQHAAYANRACVCTMCVCSSPIVLLMPRLCTWITVTDNSLCRRRRYTTGGASSPVSDNGDGGARWWFRTKISISFAQLTCDCCWAAAFCYCRMAHVSVHMWNLSDRHFRAHVRE